MSFKDYLLSSTSLVTPVADELGALRLELWFCMQAERRRHLLCIQAQRLLP